ncbi:hypothetical protein NSA52_02620 [Clostridium sporogenes]|nr:hypothetical protein [Clostridium sporogenes]MCR1973023.1 hypothetical protein [Clostridium sporogenes]
MHIIRIEQKIKGLGIKLPELSTSKAMYVPVNQLGTVEIEAIFEIETNK